MAAYPPTALVLKAYRERAEDGRARTQDGLSKVVHAALEQGLVLVAGDVLGDVGAGAFGVAHLAEDASARAGDAFDGLERSVRI